MKIKDIVAVTKYENTESLKKAISLSNGFEKLKSTDKVLIKPNIIWGGGLLRGVPKFGFITTSRIIEDLIILLKEYGCADITIGEGTVENKELGSNTSGGFKWSGVGKVAKKYGVKTMDFHQHEFSLYEIDDKPVAVSRPVLDADFFIDVPALKTHYQAQISLGIKNLKGCISMKSRSTFHKINLSRFIAALGTIIPPDLTIIDGTYGLERGPGPLGLAHRMDVIIAGQDVFSCDIVGSRIMGLDHTKINQLREFAAITKRPIDMSDMEIRGEEIENVKKVMECRLSHDATLKQAGIEGLVIQSPGEKVCTGCATNFDAGLIVFCADNKGHKFDNLELCAGESVIAKESSKSVILIGNCSINANKGRKDAIKIKGCPGGLINILLALIGKLSKRKAAMVLIVRILKTLGGILRIYNEDFLKKGYSLPDYDPKHF